MYQGRHGGDFDEREVCRTSEACVANIRVKIAFPPRDAYTIFCPNTLKWFISARSSGQNFFFSRSRQRPEIGYFAPDIQYACRKRLVFNIFGRKNNTLSPKLFFWRYLKGWYTIKVTRNLYPIPIPSCAWVKVVKKNYWIPICTMA